MIGTPKNLPFGDEPKKPRTGLWIFVAILSVFAFVFIFFIPIKEEKAFRQIHNPNGSGRLGDGSMLRELLRPQVENDSPKMVIVWR